MSTSTYPTDDLVQLVDSYTGENVNYKKMTSIPTNIDGIIYREKNSEYYKRQFTNFINIKWFGTLNAINLQRAINITQETNAILLLNSDDIINCTSDIVVTCNIEANGASIIYIGTDNELLDPFINFTHSVTVNDLKVISSTKRNLVSITSDGVTMNNCELTNNYNALGTNKVFYAFRSDQILKNTTFNGCTINGAIYILGKQFNNDFHGFKITDSDINVDYSSVLQDFYVQHDAVTIRGINGVDLLNNRFNFKNVNRGFKFASIVPDSNPLSINVYLYPTKNVNIINNSIYFKNDTNSGKQVIDGYVGTTEITVSGNKITAIGATTVFENKGEEILPYGKMCRFTNNYVEFDWALFLVQGAASDSVVRENYDFIVTGNEFVWLPNGGKPAKRYVWSDGQQIELEHQNMIDVYFLDKFIFSGNNFRMKNGDHAIADAEFMSISPCKISRIENNNYIGNIAIQNIPGSLSIPDELIFSNNINSFVKGNNMLRFYGSSSHNNVIIKNNSILSSESMNRTLWFYNSGDYKNLIIQDNIGFLGINYLNLGTATYQNYTIENVYPLTKKSISINNISINAGEEVVLTNLIDVGESPADAMNIDWWISHKQFFESKNISLRIQGNAGSLFTLYAKNNTASQITGLTLSFDLFVERLFYPE